MKNESSPSDSNEQYFSTVYQAGLTLLNYQPRTVQQLRIKLHDKGFDHQVTQQVLDKLQAQNFLNDLTYAEHWVRMRGETNPRGPHILTQELRRKGVASETIREALETSAADEAALVQRAAQKKLRSVHNLPEEKQRTRVLEFLSRRGFSYQRSRQIVEDLLRRVS